MESLQSPISISSRSTWKDHCIHGSLRYTTSASNRIHQSGIDALSLREVWSLGLTHQYVCTQLSIELCLMNQNHRVTGNTPQPSTGCVGSCERQDVRAGSKQSGSTMLHHAGSEVPSVLLNMRSGSLTEAWNLGNKRTWLAA